MSEAGEMVQLSQKMHVAYERVSERLIDVRAEAEHMKSDLATARDWLELAAAIIKRHCSDHVGCECTECTFVRDVESA